MLQRNLRSVWSLLIGKNDSIFLCEYLGVLNIILKFKLFTPTWLICSLFSLFILSTAWKWILNENRTEGWAYHLVFLIPDIQLWSLHSPTLSHPFSQRCHSDLPIWHIWEYHSPASSIHVALSIYKIRSKFFCTE